MSTVNAASVLSTMSGMTSKELATQAEQLVKSAPAGQLNALSSLDAALVDAAVGNTTATMNSFKAMTQTKAEETHIAESANRAFKRAAEAPGFAEGAYVASMPTQSSLGQAGHAAIDRVKAHPMFSTFMSEDAEPPATQADVDSDQRQIQFEKLKNEMQKITQMTQMLTNVLKAMNDQAMAAIRNIKA